MQFIITLFDYSGSRVEEIMLLPLYYTVSFYALERKMYVSKSIAIVIVVGLTMQQNQNHPMT